MKRADAICSAYNTQLHVKTITPRSYDAIVRYVSRTLPLYEAALRKLSALEPSSKDAPAVHTWLAADRRVARQVRELGLAARRRDYPGLTAAVSREELAITQSRQAATNLGLRVCGANAP